MDTQLNVWQKASGISSTATGGVEIWYAMNSGSGANTIVVTLNTPAIFSSVSVGEYSGIALTGAFDQGAAQRGVSNTGTDGITSGPVTTTFANELLLGFMISNSGAAVTAGTGYTIRESATTIVKQVNEDRIVASTGTYAGTFTATAGTPIVAVATFKGQ